MHPSFLVKEHSVKEMPKPKATRRASKGRLGVTKRSGVKKSTSKKLSSIAPLLQKKVGLLQLLWFQCLLLHIFLEELLAQGLCWCPAWIYPPWLHSQPLPAYSPGACRAGLVLERLRTRCNNWQAA